jgi:hypothetical protein
MNFKGLRLQLIILTLVLGLALLFGVRWLYQDQALNRPLEQAVRSVPGVTDVSLGQQGDTIVVRVKAGDVPRLEELVASLWRSITAVEGRQNVRLQISDTRSEALQDAYYRLHFFLQEAVATGQYSTLPDRTAGIAEASGVTRHRVFVGPDYVYLQLHQGQSALYEIVPRDPERFGSGSQGSTVVRLVTVEPWEG